MKPIDMAGVGSAGSYSILISSVMRKGTGDVVGALDVRPSGQSLRTIGAVYSGVALSAAQPSMGFVANSRSREILSARIDAKGITLKTIARVPEANAVLGPLALDAAAQRIYVADLTRGAIWVVPAAGGTPALFATGLRDVRALAADGDWVFAADGDGQRVLQFTQRPPQATPAQKSTSARRVPLGGLQVPSAVAITGAGEIAVGDSRLGEVRIISLAGGRVVRRIGS
jgi:DNA-binding beta-propeller fold protein YncE